MFFLQSPLLPEKSSKFVAKSKFSCYNFKTLKKFETKEKKVSIQKTQKLVLKSNTPNLLPPLKGSLKVKIFKNYKRTKNAKQAKKQNFNKFTL